MYVIDTSSLIDLKNHYRPSTFRAVWTRLEGLIEDRALISPYEAFREIECGEDALVEWAKTTNGFFISPSDDQGTVINEIHGQNPKFFDFLKPIDADPFCIALAVLNTRSSGSIWTVVNQEKEKHPHKIPQVCGEFGVHSMKLLDFFDALGGF